MALFRTLVTVYPVSNNPEDVSTNSWYFDANTDADLADVTTALESFYDSVGTRLSDLNRATDVTIEYYRLSDPKPRQPVRTDTFDMTTVGSDTLPTEVATCLSFQAARISGLSQARRRGRIYLGPLATTAVGNDGLLDGAWVTQVRNAGQALLTASDGQAAWKWAVYSQTDGVGHNVDNGWVDNAPDTQRRRGRDATSRSTFT